MESPNGWESVTYEGGLWEVLPLNDLKDHESGPGCWCSPNEDDEDDQGLIHNSMDQREFFEDGSRLLS